MSVICPKPIYLSPLIPYVNPWEGLLNQFIEKRAISREKGRNLILSYLNRYPSEKMCIIKELLSQVKNQTKEVRRKLEVTLFQIAIITHDLDLLNFLLQFSSQSNYLSKDNSSFLHYAVLKGFIGAIEPLLKAGLDMNHRGSKGNTPLTAAVNVKNAKMAALFIEKGADVSLKTDTGNTALHIAAIRDLHEVIPLLKEALEKKGLSIDLPGNKGYSALFAAVYFKSWKSVSVLLKLGAEKLIRDANGNPIAYLEITEGLQQEGSLIQDAQWICCSATRSQNSAPPHPQSSDPRPDHTHSDCRDLPST